MRAIIIEEDRFVEVLELMRNAAMRIADDEYLLKRCGLSKDQANSAADEMFRSINLHFVRWAQSHGARCVRM